MPAANGEKSLESWIWDAACAIRGERAKNVLCAPNKIGGVALSGCVLESFKDARYGTGAAQDEISNHDEIRNSL